MCSGTYSLSMKIRFVPECILEITIYTRFVNSIKLPLIVVEVGLSQRPGLCNREFFQMVAYRAELFVCRLEPFVNFPLSGGKC